MQKELAYIRPIKTIGSMCSQSLCTMLCDPMDCSLPGSSLSPYVQCSVIPWTVACQAPLSTGFPREEWWSGLQFTSPGNLPDSGTELKESPASPALAGKFFTTLPPGKPVYETL